MSNKAQLQTNNTALDGYIARINAAKDVAASLPEAGSGGGGSGSRTVRVSVINQSILSEVTYWDAEGTKQSVPCMQTRTVDALNGVLYYRQEMMTNYTGDYVNGMLFGTVIAVFLSDGGTMECLGDSM